MSDGWDQWWEFNRDRFLQLRREVWSAAATTGDADFALGHGLQRKRASSLRPSRNDIKTRVVPILEAMLDDASSSRNLVASACLSLARIGGVEGFRERVHKVFRTRSFEEQEIAVLSMGVDGREEMLPDLLELVRDTAEGRALVRQGQGVRLRVRSFATYGCGLIASRSENVRIKRRIFFAMRRLLDDSRISRRDLHVAALQSLRLLQPDVKTESGKRLRDDAIHYLLSLLDRDGSRRLSDIARSHTLAAMARIAGRLDPATKVARRAVSMLKGRESALVRQSAILALGEVANRADDEVVSALRVAALRAKNAQARQFAMIALGQVGGTELCDFLRIRLRSPKTRKSDLPWLSIGLALAAKNAEQSLVLSIRRDVMNAYKDVRAPQFSSGVAIALGLLGAREAEDMIATRMNEIRSQKKAAGYHAIALGLMDAGTAAADIRRVYEGAEHSDDLLAKAATALALLGDKSIVVDLTSRLRSGSGSLSTRHSLTRALGLVGDRHALSGLLDFAVDKKTKSLPRAFATVALGMIGDEDAMPWNERIAANVNYIAIVDTLSGASGVLDIL